MTKEEIIRRVELEDLLKDESLDEEHLRELIFD
jgi:hypothetical protein